MDRILRVARDPEYVANLRAYHVRRYGHWEDAVEPWFYCYSVADYLAFAAFGLEPDEPAPFTTWTQLRSARGTFKCVIDNGFTWHSFLLQITRKNVRYLTGFLANKARPVCITMRKSAWFALIAALDLNSHDPNKVADIFREAFALTPDDFCWPPDGPFGEVVQAYVLS